MSATTPDPKHRFNGPDYVPPRDQPRLSKQHQQIFALMRDANWRTLAEIEAATGHPPASISAQLRHMRKARFGSHTIEKHYRGSGLFAYRLIVNEVEKESEQNDSNHLL